MRRPWLVLTEGKLEVPAINRLFSEVGADVGGLQPLIAGSNEQFWEKARRFNRAAKSGIGVVVGLVDQENPAACAPMLLHEGLGENKVDSFVLRVAERMLEDWLLADVEGFARFVGVARKVVEKEAGNTLIHPKVRIVNLARRSRTREIREDLVPELNSRGLVGRGYTLQMERFITEYWNPRRAASRNDSLERAITALEAALS
jgi:hypothetical protein